MQYRRPILPLLLPLKTKQKHSMHTQSLTSMVEYICKERKLDTHNKKMLMNKTLHVQDKSGQKRKKMDKG